MPRKQAKREHLAKPMPSGWTHDSQRPRKTGAAHFERTARRVDDRVEVGPRILSISFPGGVKLLRGWYGTQEPVRFQRGRFKRLVEEALSQRADDPRSSGGRTGRAGHDAASASWWHCLARAPCWQFS